MRDSLRIGGGPRRKSLDTLQKAFFVDITSMASSQTLSNPASDVSLSVAATELYEAVDEALETAVTHFCDEADAVLGTIDDVDTRTRRLKHLLHTAASRHDSDPHDASLKRLQLALRCPTPASLRQMEEMALDKSYAERWPHISSSMETIKSSLEQRLAAATTHEAKDSLETVCMLRSQLSTVFGSQSTQATKTAPLLLSAGLRHPPDVDNRQAWRTLLLANQPRAVHFEALELKHFVIGYARWLEQLSESDFSEPDFNVATNIHRHLTKNNTIPSTTKIRLNEHYSNYVQTKVHHQIAHHDGDLDLMLAVSELLSLDTSQLRQHSEGAQHLHDARSHMNKRLQELKGADDAARLWARDYLVTMVQLITGRTDVRPASSNIEEDFERSTPSPAHDALTQPIAPCENTLRERRATFMRASSHILGQDNFKGVLCQHFEKDLRGHKQSPLYAYGPSRIGKSALLKMAMESYYGAQTHVVQCRTIDDDVLRGSTQRYVGSRAGQIASQFLRPAVAGDTKMLPDRSPIALIFDDIDHATNAVKQIASCVVGREPFIDSFLQIPLDWRNVHVALCGNTSEGLPPHFWGRVTGVPVRMPSLDYRKQILRGHLDKDEYGLSFTPELIHALASGTLTKTLRQEEGIAGLLVTADKILTGAQDTLIHSHPWRKSQRINSKTKYVLHTADAIDFLAAHENDPSLIGDFWRKVGCRRPSLRYLLGLEYFRLALQPESSTNERVYIARRGASCTLNIPYSNSTDTQTVLSRSNDGSWTTLGCAPSTVSSSLFLLLHAPRMLSPPLVAISLVSYVVLTQRNWHSNKETEKQAILLAWRQPHWPKDNSWFSAGEQLVAAHLDMAQEQQILRWDGIEPLFKLYEQVQGPSQSTDAHLRAA